MAFLTLALIRKMIFIVACWEYILLKKKKTTAEHKNLFQISIDHPHYVKEKLLRTLMLLRQALKEMLALKLSVEKAVYECGAEGRQRANRCGAIIRCSGITKAIKSCNFVPFSA